MIRSKQINWFRCSRAFMVVLLLRKDKLQPIMLYVREKLGG